MVLSYTHVQGLASDTWTINHNLNKKPIFDIVFNIDGVNTVVQPLNATHINENTLELLFTSSFVGAVRLV